MTFDLKKTQRVALVTGGAGFIGSNFIKRWLREDLGAVVNVDRLTYAGNPANLAEIEDDPRYVFVRGDIADREVITRLFESYQPGVVLNFAAESHVDRSIHGPGDFVHTNIVGTFNLLECARAHWMALPSDMQAAFRFLHVSTDEVYGTLKSDEPPFTEKSPYVPNSPYSASKASSDHLVRAWQKTYGMPLVTTNCSNNYGPYQFPEKLIPLVFNNALNGKPLPVYGDGRQIRDWLYVEDHCEALIAVLNGGRIGETYNIGGLNEQANIDVVNAICDLLDEIRPRADGHAYAELIEYVKDRPAHDRRYAIDASKISRELGWAPRETFESGLRKTVEWYLANAEWVDSVASGEYQEWVKKHYAE